MDIALLKKQLRQQRGAYLKRSDWYIALEPFLKKWIWTDVHDDPKIKAIREPFYALVGEMLEQNEIPLGQNGPDFDLKRRQRIETGQPPIDMVIIHHSETDPEKNVEDEARKLNAIGAIRQYAYEFAQDPELRGKPIWSGHFTSEGKQVFVAYNGFVAADGSIRWLLEDTLRQYVLWHAGSEVNDRSAALVAIGNYEHATPPLAQIDGLARAIQTDYADIPRDAEHIKGHREVNPARTCPGAFFLGENGWKNRLLSRL